MARRQDLRTARRRAPFPADSAATQLASLAPSTVAAPIPSCADPAATAPPLHLVAVSSDGFDGGRIDLGFLHGVSIQRRSTNCHLHQKGIHADRVPALAVKAGSIIFGFLLH